MPATRTELLEIAYEVGGPEDGRPLMLLHGWPDDVRGWRRSGELLHARGWRTVTPYLRGFGPTRFLTTDTIRDGRGVALAQDAIDLANGLGLETFAVAGHDWGARAAYILGALFPERVTAIGAIALAYQPRGIFKLPPFPQARRFSYQWFMTMDPDWTAITLHGYRSRWREEPVDPRYRMLQARLGEIEMLSRPTLMIQGASDFCAEPASSEGLDRYFTGAYERLVLDGVGHFPPREAPEAVAEALDRHLRLPLRHH
jgi:pimeloyl-ACP methyl ester carboxylesterase